MITPYRRPYVKYAPPITVEPINVRRRLEPRRILRRTYTFRMCCCDCILAALLAAIIIAIILLVFLVGKLGQSRSSSSLTTMALNSGGASGQTYTAGSSVPGLAGTTASTIGGPAGSTIIGGPAATTVAGPSAPTVGILTGPTSTALAGVTAASGIQGSTVTGPTRSTVVGLKMSTAAGSTWSAVAGPAGSDETSMTDTTNQGTKGSAVTAQITTGIAPTVKSSPQVTTSTHASSLGTETVVITSVANAASATTEPPTTAPIPRCPTSPIIIQQRIDRTTTFFDKTWGEMKQELGSISGNYWKGLDAINALTNSGQFKLTVMFTTTLDVPNIVDYSTFTIGDESTAYQMTIGGFAAFFTYDGFRSYSGYKFTTKDRKNDNSAVGSNCATLGQGAWWYNTCSCGACFTQGPATSYVWKLGFSTTNLKNNTMLLVCKDSGTTTA